MNFLFFLDIIFDYDNIFSGGYALKGGENLGYSKEEALSWIVKVILELIAETPGRIAIKKERESSTIVGGVLHTISVLDDQKFAINLIADIAKDPKIVDDIQVSARLKLLQMAKEDMPDDMERTWQEKLRAMDIEDLRNKALEICQPTEKPEEIGISPASGKPAISEDTE